MCCHLPFAECGICKAPERFIRSAMAAYIRAAVSAEVGGVSKAASVDFGIIDQRSFVTAVIAVNGQGFFASFDLSGESVLMPSSSHSEMIPSRKTAISALVYSLVPLSAR